MTYRNINLPDNIEPEAKAYIFKLLDILAAEDNLKEIDSCAYYMLATAYSTYIQAHKMTEEKGLISISSAGNQAIAPWCKIEKEQLTSILRILQEIGATRRSRKSISALENSGADADESPLTKFMKQNEELI